MAGVTPHASVDQAASQVGTLSAPLAAQNCRILDPDWMTGCRRDVDDDPTAFPSLNN